MLFLCFFPDPHLVLAIGVSSTLSSSCKTSHTDNLFLLLVFHPPSSRKTQGVMPVCLCCSPIYGVPSQELSVWMPVFSFSFDIICLTYLFLVVSHAVFPRRHWWLQIISYSQTVLVSLLWSSYIACFDPLLGALSFFAKTTARRLELYLEMKNDKWLYMQTRTPIPFRK